MSGPALAIPRIIVTQHSTEELGPAEEPEGFAYIDGVITGADVESHNQTTVDVVVVPCIGSHPENTWADERQSTLHNSSNIHSLWVTSSIRSSFSYARVLLYQHGLTDAGVELEDFARRLLRWIISQRDSDKGKGGPPHRPLFFLCHSVGGLVVKLALILASEKEDHRYLVDSLFGIAFFGTPHQGSRFLHSKQLAPGLAHVLQTYRPWPPSLQAELKFGNGRLAEIDAAFKDLVGDARIWTFYETSETTFSSPNGGTIGSGMITSYHSAVLGLRNETLHPVPGNHTDCPRLGKNTLLKDEFLGQLKVQLERAGELFRRPHAPMDLEKEVRAEVYGFFQTEGTLHPRPWSLKTTLSEFLDKGPTVCIQERIGDPNLTPDPQVTMRRISERRRRAMEHDAHFRDADEPEYMFEISMNSLRFTWVHVPHTNPAWVERVFKSVAKARDPPIALDTLFNAENWSSRLAKGRRSQYHAHYIKPGATCCRLDDHHQRCDYDHHNGTPPVASHIYHSIHLPYLHFDSYRNLLRRRATISARWRQARAWPVPDAIAKDNSIERKVIWQYLGHEPALHCRRTLDQFGYPTLRNTSARDDDQMVYKRTKILDLIPSRPQEQSRAANSRPSRDLEAVSANPSQAPCNSDEDEDITGQGLAARALNGCVLMVDQLWLWSLKVNRAGKELVNVVNDDKNEVQDTLITFFPGRESDISEGPLYRLADLRDTIYGDLDDGLNADCHDSWDLAALVLYHAVTVLLDTRSGDLDVLGIFDEAISNQTEMMTLSLRSFIAEGLHQDDPSEDFEATPAKIKARHRREGQIEEDKYRAHIAAVLELRDLQDELKMLDSLFTIQLDVIKEIKTHTPMGKRVGSMLTKASDRVEDYRRRVRDMAARVERTRADFDKLFEMIQRRAQVSEVRSSRLQADLAGAQGRSLLVFTIFTVVFLPLSFFTSVFGMNIREWQQQEAHLPDMATILLVIFLLSSTIIGLALVSAFSEKVARSWSVMARAWKDMVHGARDLLRQKQRQRQGAAGREHVAEESRPTTPAGSSIMEDILPTSSEPKLGISRGETNVWELHARDIMGRYNIPDENLNERGRLWKRTQRKIL